MSFATGSLVRARDRDWIVLPDSTEELVIARPLGGTEDEITGIYLCLEEVKSATFQLPMPEHLGDFRSCRLLRDALQIGFRSSAGPFRSLGRISVEPRPYQFVPLLMALRLDPIRMLIADDVGIGKTVEACLVARELLDRGECQRLAVLCPPHLAEQWQKELDRKFQIRAELVLSSTVKRLEKNCMRNQSIFEQYSHTVISMDYIKADRRRDDFIRTAPELIIVDEVHTASFDDTRNSSRHQRHELVKRLSGDPNRHLILVTATPHSGKEQAFRSLLGLLDPSFHNLPEELTGKHNEQYRRQIAQHFVQRRRADIRHFLDEDTEFPDSEAKEDHYKLTSEYKKLFQRALHYARELTQDKSGGQHRRRVRWWSALGLLRALASSPAAAAATLRSRSSTADTATASEADEVGRRQVLDMDDVDSTDAADTLPGTDTTELIESEQSPARRRLLDMAREADKLRGDLDNKVLGIVKHLKKLVNDGYKPIVFCRFIQTAEYLAEQLRNRLPKKIEVAAITGTLPPEEREQRVLALAQFDPRILVCTDCLSEGINLQEYFDSVVHYDLSWNPTRHEQREGRVDRFGQPRKTVRMLTYYGLDNQIDGVVLDVLVRKHQTIRSSLGISVPVPTNSNAVLEAVFEGLLLREQSGGDVSSYLPGFDDYFKEERAKLHKQWDNVTEKEKRSRTMFAQEGMAARVEDVNRELQAVRQAIGAPSQIESFVREAVLSLGGSIKDRKQHCGIDLSETPLAIREMWGQAPTIEAKFNLPVSDRVEYFCRTHPLVEGIADYILNSALDDKAEISLARRCGVIRTDAVSIRTTLLLLRHRYHIITETAERTLHTLAEDAQVVAFTGSPKEPQWLDESKLEALIFARPTGNVLPEQARLFIQKVRDSFSHVQPALDDYSQTRAQQLLDSHTRVRSAARIKKSHKVKIRPELPPDVVGLYVYLPEGGI